MLENQLPTAARRPRLLYIDNLRWAMIVLVISMHAADTYSRLGNWYYVDRKPLSTASLLTFAAWQMYLQSFFMGLLFFIAGFFVPTSFDRKGASRFVRDRAYRLGLPVLFYMFLLGPVTEYFCAHSWNSTAPTSFLNEWVKHIRNGQFLQENGPLWFCLALLIFSLGYVAWRALRPSLDAGSLGRRAPNLAAPLAFAFLMAGATFVVRLVLPSGYSFLNMHLGDFPQYILLFCAGVAAAREQWLGKLILSSGVRWLAIVLPVGFAAWLGILRAGGRVHGSCRSLLGWMALAGREHQSLGVLYLRRDVFRFIGDFSSSMQWARPCGKVSFEQRVQRLRFSSPHCHNGGAAVARLLVAAGSQVHRPYLHGGRGIVRPQCCCVPANPMASEDTMKAVAGVFDGGSRGLRVGVAQAY